MLTPNEICEKLIVFYEVDLIIELLQISAEELLERFEDRIETHYDRILEAIDEQ